MVYFLIAYGHNLIIVKSKHCIMIKLASILTSLFLSFNLLSQASIARSELKLEDVPKEVVEAFYNMNPDKEAEMWLEEHSFYQVKYMENGRVKFDIFNSEGGYVESKEYMPWTEAPEKLKDGLNKTFYKYWEVVESYRMTDNTENLYYTILVRNNKDGSERTVYFDKTGKLEDKSKSGYTK